MGPEISTTLRQEIQGCVTSARSVRGAGEIMRLARCV